MKLVPNKSHFRATHIDPNKKNGILSKEFLQRYKNAFKERGRYLHSREHVLADDLSRMMAEPKKFAAYLGIAKLYYESDLRALAKRVLEKEDLPLEARGKYFFAALKDLRRKSGVKIRPRKKHGKNKANRKNSRKNSKK